MSKLEIRSALPKCARLDSKPHLFCPGCGHPEVLKALGFAVDELGLQRRIAFGVDIGCSLLAWDFFDFDTVETHHGRTVPVMVGLRLGNPEAIAVAYVGDGGAYAIGAGHLLNAAIRNDNILTIVVNNGLYAMTGGQEAPTTHPGWKVKTAPYGADQYYIKAPEIIRNVNPAAFVARGITSRQPELRQLMKDALQHINGNHGFAFLEVLSQCPLNWKTMDSAEATFRVLEQEHAKLFPTGRF
ncbi:2-oxoglutarate synthase [Patescibacteria group bacterium]|nr:2-oxoglutarate synthase [Patescibacteria group bacterium]MBU1029496.1 2-oxoglutarate synthase [Patescibacteria group bacterium]MBU1916445.1 2-oxoglutarate synthase [Patescibacteria group bacterium]